MLPFVVALGIGLLVGLERERRKGEGPARAVAGIRTFALTALLGALARQVGGELGLLAAAVFAGALIAIGYQRSPRHDPGITTEVAQFVTLLLGALATHDARLAAGLAVLVAGLLAMRTRLHRLATRVITSQELHDGLLLAAAALVVLPLLPDRDYGPSGALNPYALWRLVVLILAIGIGGHVAARVVGPRYGLPLAGLASGFVSSAATHAAMGVRAQADARLRMPAAAGATLSSVATVVQMGIVLAAVSSEALAATSWPLACAGVAALAAGVVLTVAAGRSREAADVREATDVTVGHAFSPSTALVLGLTLGVVTAGLAALQAWLGPRGLLAGAFLAGFADAHAVAISTATLVARGDLDAGAAVVPILIGFTSNSAMKVVAARLAGGWPFVLLVAPGVVLIAAAAWAGMLVR
jgi:uncharacterized membrane protein (DUF4010 family)